MMNTRKRRFPLCFGLFIAAASSISISFSPLGASEGTTDHIRRQTTGHIRRRFSLKEDRQLEILVWQHGTKDWSLIASSIAGRIARQCRERWNNYVNPELNNGPWTDEEDALLLQKYKELGPQWRSISLSLYNRSRNNCRNRWQFLRRNFLQRKLPSTQQKRPATAKEDASGSNRPSANYVTPENDFDLLNFGNDSDPCGDFEWQS
jgi:hypothetical protein